MENFACIEAADVLRLERHNAHGLAVASDKLDLVGFVVAMHEDNGTDIANLEAMLRERARLDNGIMFLDRHLTDSSPDTQRRASAHPTRFRSCRLFDHPD